MKKILLLLTLGMLLCTTGMAKRVGVYCFLAENGEQIYEDENMQLLVGKLDANNVGVVVVNKTDKVLYIDKANSFLYLNGETNSYFKNSAYSTGQSNSTGASMNMGGLAKSMGIGGVAGGALSGLTIGGGSTATNTTTVFEQRVIGVAPRTSQVLTTLKFTESMNQVYLKPGNPTHWGGSKGKFIDPNTGQKKKFEIGDSFSYSFQQTPFAIRATVKYSLSESFPEEACTMATAGNYIEHIVIDNKDGVKKSGVSLPYCSQYANKPYLAFQSNGSYLGWYIYTVSLIGCIVIPIAIVL